MSASTISLIKLAFIRSKIERQIPQQTVPQADSATCPCTTSGLALAHFSARYSQACFSVMTSPLGFYKTEHGPRHPRHLRAKDSGSLCSDQVRQHEQTRVAASSGRSG